MKSERISPFWVNGYQPFSAGDSCLFACFYKGIIDCGVLYSFHTSEEQAVLSLDSAWSYRSFRRHIVYGVFSVISVGEDLIPEVLQIVKSDNFGSQLDLL